MVSNGDPGVRVPVNLKITVQSNALPYMDSLNPEVSFYQTTEKEYINTVPENKQGIK